MQHKKTQLFFAAVGACAALGAAGPAWSSVDTTPKPGGVYKLKPGVYVAEGKDCAAPDAADLRYYDGKGLATTDAASCKVKVLKRAKAGYGMRYTVEQRCDDGEGKAQRQTVTVDHALRFTQRAGGTTTSFRYCPVDQLPASLREAAGKPARR
ncbi:hypothetical protein B0920_02600 [Massilia sp. KIM]|uniref:hypothetical protein n=1 Tax=Massilia sp. KIM TaxID=1955422 RepID=UPI00098F88D5|nr:hypothetical protein [Massilia sp. KIM]OON62376.1 hypothetical protein B0920_02600 [Massilia sp. KIM]